MKIKSKIHLHRIDISVLFILLHLAFHLPAQDNAINKHYTEFVNNSNFDISYVSKEMFRTIIEKNKNKYGKELTEIMESLNSLHIVTAYKNKPDLQYNEAMNIMKITNYELLFTKQDQVDKFSLFISKKDNKIIEMVLIARDHVDFVILDITGDIDLKSIVFLGEAMRFQGSEFLDQMNLSEEELKKLHIGH